MRRPRLHHLVGAEVQKLLGRPWLALALLAPAAVVIIQVLLGHLLQVREALATGGPLPEELQVETAFGPAAAALRSGSVTAALLVGLTGALALAEERRLGTLRTILAGPVQRWQLFAAKGAGLLVLTVLLVGSASLIALLTGAVLGEYQALPAWEYVGLELADMWHTLLWAMALSAAAVLAVGCLALCCSAVTSSGISALILLALVVLGSLLAMHLGGPRTRELVAACSPLTYVTRPGLFVGEQVAAIGASSWCIILLPEPHLAWEARIPWLVCLGSSLCTGVLGLAVFSRRNVL